MNFPFHWLAIVIHLFRWIGLLDSVLDLSSATLWKLSHHGMYIQVSCNCVGSVNSPKWKQDSQPKLGAQAQSFHNIVDGYFTSLRRWNTNIIVFEKPKEFSSLGFFFSLCSTRKYYIVILYKDNNRSSRNGQEKKSDVTAMNISSSGHDKKKPVALEW